MMMITIFFNFVHVINSIQLVGAIQTITQINMFLTRTNFILDQRCLHYDQYTNPIVPGHLNNCYLVLES